MPGWTKAAVDRWTEAAAIAEGSVLRAVNKECIRRSGVRFVIVGWADG
jgi:hypothetical protein